MKTKLKEFAQFIFRCILAGGILLIGAGIIYGVTWGLVALIGKEMQEDYTFWNQYIQIGFWVGFAAIVKDLKEFWR